MYENPSFKIILIGDSGTYRLTQAQERQHSSKSIFMEPSKMNMKSQLVLTSTPKQLLLTNNPFNYKFGTL